jgi:hypothetical protein
MVAAIKTVVWMHVAGPAPKPMLDIKALFIR